MSIIIILLFSLLLDHMKLFLFDNIKNAILAWYDVKIKFHSVLEILSFKSLLTKLLNCGVIFFLFNFNK